MNDLQNCQFYCLSYYEEKRNNMENQFKKLNINCFFYDGINHNDNRINNKKYNKYKKKMLSTIYGHLDIINHFYYNDDSKYAVICEDDIIIHKDIKNLLRKTLIDFNILELDLLLLSYLLPYKISKRERITNYSLKREVLIESHYSYHNYPNYMSGTQMYLISKPYAKYIIDNYKTNNTHMLWKFCSVDKILLQYGNRALIYPMLAIENNEQEDPYHKLCHKIHIDDIIL